MWPVRIGTSSLRLSTSLRRQCPSVRRAQARRDGTAPLGKSSGLCAHPLSTRSSPRRTTQRYRHGARPRPPIGCTARPTSSWRRGTILVRVPGPRPSPGRHLGV
jgi:hypothetical protein